MSIYNLKNKLLRNFGANAFGQFVTIVIQLINVPFFLQYWGVELYGEWLVLSAIPTYLNLSDIGFASVAANDMTMRVAKGDKQGALEVYQSIWIFVCTLSIIVGCALVLAFSLFSFSELFSISHISSYQTQQILVLLVLYVLIGLQINILLAGFRAVGLYASGTLMNNTVRLFECLATIIALILGSGVLDIAIVVLIVRCIGLFIIWLVLDKKAKWLSLGYKVASIKKVQDLFKPALAFMSFPLGIALSIQGMVLLIGATLGPASVVIFSSYRTVTRLIVQFITMINQAIWPEVSVAYGAGQFNLLFQLHRKVTILTVWVSLFLLVLVALFGEWGIGIWTRHAFEHNRILLILLLGAAFLNVLWQTSWVFLMAINKHKRISLVFILATISTLILSSLLMPIFGVNGAAFALLIVELPLIYFAINSVLRLLNDTWNEYVKAIINLKYLRG